MAMDLSGVATQLINSLGAKVFYAINTTQAPINPDTGMPTGSPIETRIPFAGAMVKYSTPYRSGSNIQTGDKKLIAEPSADIRLGTVIEDYAGQLWAIVDPGEVNPSGVTQVYELQIRKQ